MSRRFLLLALALLPLSGCSACVDEDQLDRIKTNMDAVPADARAALGAEKVEIQTVGATASDGVGSRKLKLRLGPSVPTALDAYVRGCQAAVAALEPTNTRLYGMPAPPSLAEGGDPSAETSLADLEEIDDERCLRGYGVTDLTGGYTGGGLLVGVRGPGGTVTDTAVSFDPDDRELTTGGLSSPPDDGPFVPKVAPLPGTDRITSLPATPQDFAAKGAGEDWLRKVFVVPSGQQLTLKARCAEPSAEKSLGFRPGSGNSLSFYPYPYDATDHEADETASCTDTLVREMTPQLRYRQNGKLVDEYWFQASASAIGEQPSTDIRVTAAP